MKIKPKIVINQNPKGTVYWASDIHYNHFNAIHHANRPFKTVEEMDEYILETLRTTLTPSDILFTLGDIFWKCDYEKIKKFVDCIPCPWYFILGNHDNENILKFEPLAKKLKKVGDIFDVNLRDEKEEYNIIMSHYPIESWPRSHYGSVHLHGHNHGGKDEENEEKGWLRMDVGFDAKLVRDVQKSFLVPWKTIKEKIEEIKLKNNIIC